MFIVHLFVSYAYVNLCHFSLPLDVRGWLRLLLLALPGHFCLPFCIMVSARQSLSQNLVVGRWKS